MLGRNAPGGFPAFLVLLVFFRSDGRRSAPFVHAISVVNRSIGGRGGTCQVLTIAQGISFVSNDATGPMTLRFHQPQQ